MEITATRWDFPLATFEWPDETFWVWHSGWGGYGYWEDCYPFVQPSPSPRHDERTWRLRIIANMMKWDAKALIASVCETTTRGRYTKDTKVTIYKPPQGNTFAGLAKECIGTRP